MINPTPSFQGNCRTVPLATPTAIVRTTTTTTANRKPAPSTDSLKANATESLYSPSKKNYKDKEGNPSTSWIPPECVYPCPYSITARRSPVDFRNLTKKPSTSPVSLFPFHGIHFVLRLRTLPADSVEVGRSTPLALRRKLSKPWER